MLAPWASAKNVDLVTLPKRNTVELTIYNSADITLAKETRNITVKKGSNQIQFSWAGTLIDPTSVEMRVLEHSDKIEIADTVFPGQKPQHLIWNIESEFEGQVPVEVSYFTSGLTWQMDYVAITDPGEEHMQFRGYVRVFNNSGEEYENAHIRLIVGKINLVEKISDLARRWGQAVPEGGDVRKLLEQRVMLGAFVTAEAVMDDSDSDGNGLGDKRQIVKEGLSEYFMFSVQGSETIRNGWSKRMEAVKADDVKFDILYRMRGYQYGSRPVRFFIWRNDDEHRLGESPLPDGQVRIFRENGKDGLSFLGQQQIRYVPIKAEIEINLGPDDLVVYETFRQGTRRDNFSFRRSGGREYVDGWDERTRWVDSIRNYRTKPIRFELRRQWGGHVDYSTEIKTKLFDYRTIEATFDVPARGKELYPCMVVTHNGVNKKQERIELKKE
jgi:hypothetical protein